uniref:DNA-binding protein n=1 Tax=Ignisphaera aggregans TaxID=334771 RepID=A0A7C2Z124_9CREN
MNSAKIQAVMITVTSSPSSIFGRLSRQTGEKINLFVLKHPRESLYYTLVYIPKPIESGIIVDTLRSQQNKLIKISKHVGVYETFIAALKERCEFYELVERYNVVLSVPYIIYRGLRTYCVYGEQRDVDRYLENLSALYSKGDIVTKRVDLARCMDYLMRNVVDIYLLSFLTDKERQILLKAFESGYISSRRKVNLGELAETLNIAKPTASLMLRRAVEKVLKRIFESESR